MRMIYKVAKNAKCQNGDETTKRNGEAVLKGVTKAAIRVLKSHGKVEFRTLDVDTWRDRNGSHYVLHSTCWWIAHNRIKLTNPLNSCLVLKGIKHYISCSYCYFLSHVFFSIIKRRVTIYYHRVTVFMDSTFGHVNIHKQIWLKYSSVQTYWYLQPKDSTNIMKTGLRWAQN